jgi:hypothetical protein
VVYGYAEWVGPWVIRDGAWMRWALVPWKDGRLFSLGPIVGPRVPTEEST